MPFPNAEQVVPIFFGVWIVLALFTAAFFFLNKNAELKRQVWPPFVVTVGVLFLGFVWAMGFPALLLLIGLPVVALITILNLRAVQFCSSCGATNMSQNPLSRPAFCSKCGAGLTR